VGHGLLVATACRPGKSLGPAALLPCKVIPKSSPATHEGTLAVIDTTYHRQVNPMTSSTAYTIGYSITIKTPMLPKPHTSHVPSMLCSVAKTLPSNCGHVLTHCMCLPKCCHVAAACCTMDVMRSAYAGQRQKGVLSAELTKLLLTKKR
jgi:hypothetical protein